MIKVTNTEKAISELSDGKLDSALSGLYADKTALPYHKDRLIRLTRLFGEIYPDTAEGELRFFSAPGRTEIIGNHTDHNRGICIAAAIDLDAVACVRKRDDMTVRVKSAEYPKTDVVDITSLDPVAAEASHSSALIRGIAAGFVKNGYKVGGFDAVTMTDVKSGSGLSSSAAFEVLIATVMNYLYNDGQIPPDEIAKIGQFSENKFFMKPCGLMDQMASAVGGFVEMDFKDPAAPGFKKIPFDITKYGYRICITDTKGDHSDLTDDYSAIRGEMEAVAGFFGKSCLRECSLDQVLANAAELKKEFGDRAVLRAIHFFKENDRVDELSKVLGTGDIDAYLALIRSSANSSYKFNQNVFTPKKPKEQPIALAICLSEHVLGDRGACRVHGGGFAGTMQAYVPEDLLDEYKKTIDSVFGEGSCMVVSIRDKGGCEII